VRERSNLRPLLHGDEYFADLCAELGRAKTRVTIAGWCITPLMSLQRDDHEAVTASVLGDVLKKVSERAEVYVLLWEGAPALFQPTTRMVKQLQAALAEVAPRVRCVLDGTASFSHDHHQKAVTIDGRVAYVGGIDLTTYAGDRWDTAQHPLRFGPNWHDVQMRVEGEAVRDIEENFCQRWNAVTGESLQPLSWASAGDAPHVPVQVVRTIPKGFYPFAEDGIHGIGHAYLAAIGEAKRFIYLENQYLWSPEVVDALIEAMNRPREEPFRIVILLPAKAFTGKYDNDEHVRTLQEADNGRGIFAAYAPYSGGPALGPTGYHYLPVYVHAKVGIIDDEWLTVGSANLNTRGFVTDSEINVQAIAPEIAKSLRVRLWADHLHLPEDEIKAADPIAMIDGAWRETAEQLTHAMHTRTMPPRGGVAHYQPGRGVGSRVLDGIQLMTLEH
jgi:phosphatidylserine/phosphatidylglycerophosphate/cardiolipin synthase-like enzyme